MADYCFETQTISEFLIKIKQPNFKDLLTQEFRQLETVSLQDTTNNFSDDENAEKNRWHDIPCWDHSRVILKSSGNGFHEHPNSDSIDIVITNEDSDSTYIHANYVDGYEKPNKFICSQGCKKNTAGDFWNLIWQEGTLIIVALTEVDEGDICYEYWVSQEGYRIIFGRYSVETLDIKQEFGCEITKLRLTDVTIEDSRVITHFWYVNWPEHGIPTNLEEFVALRSQVNQHQQKLMERAELYNHPEPGPVVVHCSAGVGRTGSFCALDYAMDRLNKEKTISIPTAVIKIREMRHSSVMKLEQYMFIYKVVEHLLQTA